MRAVLNADNPHPIADWIRKQTQRQNFPAAIVGNPQTGKSTMATALGKQIDPDFTIHRIAWTGEQFLHLVNDQSLKRGSCIIVEEAGVSVNRGEWYSFMNKAILYVAQTFGYRGFCVLFLLPSLSLLDSRVVKLMRGYFETFGIDFNRRVVKFTFQTIETRKKVGIKGKEIYYYRPVIMRKNAYGDLIPCLMTSSEIEFPDESFRKDYFKKADEYKESLSKTLEKEASHVDIVTLPFNFESAVKEMTEQKNIEYFITDKGAWNYSRLSAEFNISLNRAKTLGGLVEKEFRDKGLKLPEPRIIKKTMNHAVFEK